MGSLRNLPITDFIENFGCSLLVETGSGLGGSISFCKKLSFSHIYSCEINEYLYSTLDQIYADDSRVTLYHLPSEDMLDKLLPEIGDENIIYWLDAHFPGADFGLNSYDSESNERIRLPLETELRIIKKHRSNFNDVIIIDDLRIYEDGPFANGPAPLPDRLPRGQRTLNFINELFGDSHVITRVYSDEGYIFVTPKSITKKHKKPISQITLLLNGNENDKKEAIRRTQFYFSMFENNPSFFCDVLEAYSNNLPPHLEDENAKSWRKTLLETPKDAKAIIYGTGFHALLVTKIAKELNIDILYYASSDSGLIGQIIDGKPVLSINGIFQTLANTIIIASKGSKDRISDEIKLKNITNGMDLLIL